MPLACIAGIHLVVVLTRKKVHHPVYGYPEECQRVDGRPRITQQKYLGISDHRRTLLEGAEKGGGPIEVDVADLGVAHLLRLSREVDRVASIDRLVPKRDRGCSVGEHLRIAILDRCLSLGSMQGVRPWFDRPLRPRILGKKEGLSSQDYWVYMDRIDEAAIETIPFETTRRVQARFGLTTDIPDHDDRGNEVPERGNAKDCRTGLRLVGLALLAGRDHGIPLLHRTYPGNQSVYPLFAQESAGIRRWAEAMGKSPKDVTRIFDKGNPSKPNLDSPGAAEFHNIGTPPPLAGARTC